MESNGYSLADIGAMMKSNDGFLEGNGIIILILFFLMFGGFGGWGASATANAISNDFIYTNLSNQMNQGFSNIQAQCYSIDKDILNQTNTINQTLCAGFNSVNSNISNLGYQMQQNCCDLKTALHTEGELTRALITENEVNRLRTDLQSAQLTLSNANQTQNILNALGTYQPYSNGCGCNCY